MIQAGSLHQVMGGILVNHVLSIMAVGILVTGSAAAVAAVAMTTRRRT